MNNSSFNNANPISNDHNSSSSALVFLTIFRAANLFLDSLGFFAFGTVALLTLRHKPLQSTCHRLISLYALSSLFSKCMGILSTIPAQWLPYNISACLHAIVISLAFAIFPLMLAIGMDRLLSISFPLWYRKRRANAFFWFSLAFCLGYVLLLDFTMNSTVLSQRPSQELLGPSMMSLTAIGGPYIWGKLSVAFVLATFFCYLLMTFKVLLDRQMGNQAVSLKRTVFKSLVLIMLVQIGTWIFALSAYSFVFEHYPVGSPASQLRFAFVNCLLSLVTNSEMLLLYCTSSAHKDALREDCSRILRLFTKPNIVKPNVITA